jgi:hypothetical protein
LSILGCDVADLVDLGQSWLSESILSGSVAASRESTLRCASGKGNCEVDDMLDGAQDVRSCRGEAVYMRTSSVWPRTTLSRASTARPHAEGLVQSRVRSIPQATSSAALEAAPTPDTEARICSCVASTQSAPTRTKTRVRVGRVCTDSPASADAALLRTRTKIRIRTEVPASADVARLVHTRTKTRIRVRAEDSPAPSKIRIRVASNKIRVRVGSCVNAPACAPTLAFST